MIARSAIICCGFLIIIQSVPMKMAIRTSDVDEFMIEDQRTHRRENFIVQRGLENEDLGKIDNIGVQYSTDFQPGKKSEQLPAIIMDYANLIRNDIILLDNSVETRTRKRGNIKVKKYKSDDTLDTNCSCEHSKQLKRVCDPSLSAADCYPQFIETWSCNNTVCPHFSKCIEQLYSITILKKRKLEPEDIEMPRDLKKRWIAEKVNITVGCLCSRDRRDHG